MDFTASSPGIPKVEEVHEAVDARQADEHAEVGID
jgi:hypothetical protein